VLIPLLLSRGIHVQVVTSAFRTMGPDLGESTAPARSRIHRWLQPEHDVRRAPATYDRILKNIVEQRITVHCTVTGQMMKRQDTWPNSWSSDAAPGDREGLVQPVHSSGWRSHAGNLEFRGTCAGHADMVELRKQHPKLDMPEAVIRQFASPPHRPQDCVLRSRLRRCRRTCRPRSLHASLAGILIARPAMASHPWAWLPSRAQIGRNTLRRDHFQSLGQDCRHRASLKRSIKPKTHYGYCSKRTNVRQPGTKEELVCEEFSQTKTFVHTR